MTHPSVAFFERKYFWHAVHTFFINNILRYDYFMDIRDIYENNKIKSIVISDKIQ